MACPKSNRLTLSFDYNNFRPDWHGRAEFRFHTAQAARFYEELVAHGAIPDGNGLTLSRGLL